MENPKKVGALNIAIRADDRARVLRIKHALEVKEQKPVSISELIRRALTEYEKSIEVTA